MAVSRKKKPAAQSQLGKLAGAAEAIAQAVKELFETHASEIQAVIEESETRQLAVAFGVEIDDSESELSLKTRIRFAQTVTDVRLSRLDDPNQLNFTMLTQEQFKERNATAKAEKEQAAADAADREDSATPVADGAAPEGGEPPEKPKRKRKAKK
jgi:RNase H-fold protein (predicted Holliday junction resolvase)